MTCDIQTPSEVVAEICRRECIDAAVLRSRIRTARTVRVRRVVAVALRSMGLTLTEIGHHLGGRSHNTVGNLLNGGGW